MKAILMAAGMGTRISRTVQKPKCTLEVNGVPLIRHTVDLLEKNGIKVAVVVGYRHEDVRKALHGTDAGFFYNPFYSITNSLSSLWFADSFLEGDEDVILINADTYFEQPILDALTSDGHKLMMLGDKSRVDEGDYFFNVDDSGYLVDYGKELTIDNRNCEYVGFAKISAEGIPDFRKQMHKLIDSGEFNLWWENALYEFLKTSPVFVKDVSEIFWAEIDYMDDYQRILAYIDGKGWK